MNTEPSAESNPAQPEELEIGPVIQDAVAADSPPDAPAVADAMASAPAGALSDDPLAAEATAAEGIAAEGIAAADPDGIEAADVAVPPPPPPPPRPKPITWETERNEAAAALARVGASPREARVLASNAARATSALKSQAGKRSEDATVLVERAAKQVLAEHRSHGVPSE